MSVDLPEETPGFDLGFFLQELLLLVGIASIITGAALVSFAGALIATGTLALLALADLRR